MLCMPLVSCCASLDACLFYAYRHTVSYLCVDLLVKAAAVVHGGDQRLVCRMYLAW